MERDKQAIEIVTKKQKENLDMEITLKADESLSKRPLCLNCHTAGHNKTVVCCFSPCSLAAICTELKRHPNKEKIYKTVKMELKEAKMYAHEDVEAGNKILQTASLRFT